MARILDEKTEQYLQTLRPPVDDLLAEMEEHAEEESIPIAAREVARLQTQMVRATDADRVLEFGTAIGYSTVQVARAGAEVVTLERDDRRIAEAEEYVERAGVADRVTIVEGPALESLPDLEGPFDVVFVDAAKEEYSQYLQGSLPMMPAGGVVVVDNLLWGGRVPEAGVAGGKPDERTGSLVLFNDEFVTHGQLESLVLPLGDGTGLAVKTA